MIDVTLYRLSIPFAIVSCTGAGIFAVLSKEIFRESPFGTALKLLTVVMAIVTAYHSGLLVFGSETLILQLLLLIGYVLVSIALFVVVSELSGDSRCAVTFRHSYALLAPVVGLLLYVVGGSLSEVFFPPILHWVHGFAALFVIAGLYNPIHSDRTNPWSELLSNDATEERQRTEWMVPMDDAILEVLYSSSLVLTPAVIAYNLDYSRAEVNRRLTELRAHEAVERVERGKYRLTDRGERLVGRDGAASPLGDSLRQPL